MDFLKATAQSHRLPLALFLPFCLWVAVWLGLQAGPIGDLFKSGTAEMTFHQARSVLPLCAGLLALTIVLVNIFNRRPAGFFPIGPLSLAILYGLIGTVASFQSPDWSVALYWSLAYVSVPMVLLAIVWGTTGTSMILRVINFNWLLITLAVTALFFFALLYLSLGQIILTSSAWFECPLNRNWQDGSWFAITSGVLRPTGVGRYAAIASLLALARLWQGEWRALWGFIFIASFILLLTSGARNSIVGFGVAASVIVLFYGGKKAAAWGALGAIALAPIILTTGIHNEFLDRCIFRGGGADSTEIQAPPPVLESAGVFQPFLNQPGTPGQLTISSLDRPVVGATPQRASAAENVATPQAPNEPSEASSPLEPRNEPSETSPPVNSPAEPDPQVKAASARSAISLTGRVPVWKEGLRLFKESPALGRGFHADRLLLGTHMHNAYMHALLQTGILGIMPFVGALLLGWVLLIKLLITRATLPQAQKHQIVIVAGIMVFLTVRTITESTGAFFGVDWFLLAPLLLYLQQVGMPNGNTEDVE